MSRPIAARRHAEILRRLQAVGAVSVGELADSFGVSHETVRRDLKALADLGQLDIVHGGAVLSGREDVVPTPSVRENLSGRALIARAAAGLVREGSAVLLDGGTLTNQLAHELAKCAGLTICTNSLSHASLLQRVPSHRVFVLGGRVEPDEGVTWGTDAIAMLANFRVDVAFVVADGFAEDGSPTGRSRGLAQLKGQMILSGPTYLLAEHSAFQRLTPFRVLNADKVSGIIVDQEPSPALAAAWASSGSKVVVARDEGHRGRSEL